MPAPTTPAARLAAAIASAPPTATLAVPAADLHAVAAAVPDAKRTVVTAALAAGAADALKGLSPGRAARQTVYVVAGDLGQLLEAAGAHAQ